MKNKCFAVLFFCLISAPLVAQENLFDSTHSHQYADFLFNSQNYNLAKQEYTRLHFMNKQNLDFQTKMLESYRLANDFTGGLSIAKTLYESDSVVPKPVSNAYLHLLFSTNYHYRTAVFLQSNPTFSPMQKVFYQSANFILEGKINEAENLLTQYKNGIPDSLRNIETILLAHHDFKPKSKALAFGLATLVPGSGKVYLGQWKDGLAAFVYTGLSVWQSYRGFDKKGIKSIYGWGFGGLATGFYLGNVYGTMKSLKIRRQKYLESIKIQTKNVVNASF
jgi:hypothetical protein